MTDYIPFENGDQYVDDDGYLRDAYFNKPYEVECVLCGTVLTTSESELRRLGWMLTEISATCCPRCLKNLEWYEIGKGGKRLEKAA